VTRCRCGAVGPDVRDSRRAAFAGTGSRRPVPHGTGTSTPRDARRQQAGQPPSGARLAMIPCGRPPRVLLLAGIGWSCSDSVFLRSTGFTRFGGGVPILRPKTGTPHPVRSVTRCLMMASRVCATEEFVAARYGHAHDLQKQVVLKSTLLRLIYLSSCPALRNVNSSASRSPSAPAGRRTPASR
jgi:hypothetical protein